MSITYEEALATLEAMFGAPWTRETLDQVLRHEKGHMENTCDRILNHGSQDPNLLIERLKSGGPEPQLVLDEALARQLAGQQAGGRGGGGGGSSSTPTTKRGRGTPTQLPVDFLRIPGYAPSATAGGAPIDDETLARMLQDELFSQELARNPDFAHLARGRHGGRDAPMMRASNARMPAAAGGARASGVDEGPNIMKNLAGTC